MKLQHLPVLIVVFFAILAPNARGETFTWKGSTSSNLATSSNWDGGVAPTPTDDILIFPANPDRLTLTQNFDLFTDFHGLSFQTPGYTLSGNNFDMLPSAGARPFIQLLNGVGNGTVTINAPFRIRSSGSAIFNIHVAHGSSVLDINSVISNESAFAQELGITGDGTVRFDAAMGYTGLTTVGTTTDNSRLVVTGSVAGPVLVDYAGTLHATGEIGDDGVGDILTVRGALKPGDPAGSAIGSPIIRGDLVFEQGVSSLSKVFFDIQGSAPGNYDRISVSGNIQTGGAHIVIPRPSVGFPIGESFMLIESAGANPINHSNPFKIDNIAVLEGSEFTIGMNRYRFSYQGGTGNDFVATTVPSLSLGSRVWDGGGANLNFSEAANWVDDALPDAAHTLVFGSLAPLFPLNKRQPINDIGGNPYALSFTASGYELSGTPLTLTGGLTASHATGTTGIGLNLALAAPQTFSLTGAGRLDLNADIETNVHHLTMETGFAGETHLLGRITGAEGLSKTGSGLMIMAGANTNSYGNITIIGEGELRCSRDTGNRSIPTHLHVGDGIGIADAIFSTTVAEQIADDKTVRVRSDGYFLPGAFETIGGLVLDGGVVDSGAHILAVAGNITANQNTTIPSPLQIKGSVRDWTVAAGKELSLTGPLTISPANTGTTQRKLGAGTLVLSGNTPNTVMELAAGTIRLANSTATTTLGVALNGGTLEGAGKVLALASLEGGGVVSPATGTGTGIIQTTGLTLGNSTELVLDVQGTTPGSGHDQLVVTGPVALDNTALTLRNTISSLLPIGTTFVLIDNDGTDPVTGTFAGLPEGAIIQTQFNQYIISYVGGTGNDVTLTVALPGPSNVVKTWTGGGGNPNWTTAANWDAGAPQPGDSLVFPAPAHESSTNDYPEGFTFNNITFQGTPPAFLPAVVISGNATRLVGNILSNVDLGFGGGTQDVRFEVPVTFASTAFITNTGARRLLFTETITGAAGGIVFLGDNIDGTDRRHIVFSGGTLSGPGPIELGGNALLDLGAAAHDYAGTTQILKGLLLGNVDQVLRNNLSLGGVGIIAQATLSGSATANPGAVVIGEGGTINLTSGSLICSTLTLGGGTLSANGRPVTTTGDVTIHAGVGSIGTLTASQLVVAGGAFATNGAVNVTTLQANGGDFSTSAPITAETITIAGGTFSGATLITADSLVMTSGTFNQATQVQVGSLNLAGGTVGGINGQYTVAGASTVQVLMPCHSLSANVLNVSGGIVAIGSVSSATTATVTGSINSDSFSCTDLELENGTIVAAATATIANPLVIDGGDSFTAGTLNATSGATVSSGSLTCGSYVSGAGTGLVLNNGSLEIIDSLTATTLTLDGGTFTGPGAGLEVTGVFQTIIPVQCASITAGTLQINAGAVSASDSVMAGTLNLTGGSLTCSGPVAVSGASTVSAPLACATFTTATLALTNTGIAVDGLAQIGGDLAIDGSDSFTCGSLRAANFSIAGGFSPNFTVATDVTLSGNATILKSISIPGRLSFSTTNRTITVGTAALSFTTFYVGGLGGEDSPVHVTKSGGGILSVSSSLSHLTEVVVAAGTFRSDAPDGGGVGHILVDGGTLTGTGIFGPVTLKGSPTSVLAPGSTSGAGILELSELGDASGTAPPQIDFEIFGTNLPGTFHDQIRVTGNIAFDPAVQTRLNLQLKARFFTKPIPLEATRYLLIDKTSPGPIAGQLFDGATPITEGYELDLGDDVIVRLSYLGGDGNDFTATVISSPAGPFREWTGASLVDSNWSTSENWKDNIVPESGASIRFPANAARQTNHNDLSNDLPIGLMRVEAPYTISGNRLKLSEELELAPASGTATLDLPLFFINEGSSLGRIDHSGAGSARINGTITLDHALTLFLNRIDPPDATELGPLEISAVLANAGASGNGVEIHGGGRVRFLSAPRAYDQATRVIEGTLESFSSEFGVIPGDLHIGGGSNPAAYVFTGLDLGIPDTATVRLLANGLARLPARPDGSFSGDMIESLSFEGGTLLNEGVFNIIKEVRASVDTVVNAPLIFRSFDNDSAARDRVIVDDGVTLTVGPESVLIYINRPPQPDQPTTLQKLGAGSLVIEGEMYDIGTLDVIKGFVGPQGEGSIRSGSVVVRGGTLGGSGEVESDQITFDPAEGGVLAPGGVTPSTRIGKLHFVGNASATSETTDLRFQIGGTEAGTEFDQLLLRNNTGSTFHTNSATLSIELVDGFHPLPGQKFLIIDKESTGAITGLFSNGEAPAAPALEEGAEFIAAGIGWSISYAAGPLSNSVELTALGSQNTGILVEHPAETPHPSGSGIDLGPVLIGGHSDFVFTIRNNGGAPLILPLTPRVQFTGSPEFSIFSQPESPVPGDGGTTTFTLRYTPVTNGPQTGTLRIANNTLLASEFTLEVTGRGLNTTTPPVLTLLGDNPLTFEAAATYTDPGATATDNAAGNITPVITSNTVVSNVPGSYQVTWTATDAGGLIDSETRTVNVVDTTPPSIQAPPGGFAPLLLGVGETVPDYLAQAVVTDVVGVATVTQNPPAGTLVTLEDLSGVVLTATDTIGNSANFFVPAFPIILPVSHDPVAEFSIDDGNPNGVWSYGKMNSNSTILDLHPHSENFSTQTADDPPQAVNVPRWRQTTASSGPLPGIVVNNTPSIIQGTLAVAHTGDPVAPEHVNRLNPGEIFLQPGNSMLSVLRFTSPADRTYRVQGEFFGANVNNGVIVDVSLVKDGVALLNNRRIDTRALPAGTRTGPGTGAPFDFVLQFNEGDIIDFRVNGADGFNVNNGTGLTLSITEVQPPAALDAVWLGGGPFNWSDSTRWTFGTVPRNNFPLGALYSATVDITGSTPTLDVAVEVQKLTLGIRGNNNFSGTISGAQPITIHDTFNWHRGQLSSSAPGTGITFGPSSTVNVAATNGATQSLSSTILNQGNMTVSPAVINGVPLAEGSATFVLAKTNSTAAAPVFTNEGTFTLHGVTDLVATGNGGGSIINNGTFIKSGAAGEVSHIANNHIFTNNDLVQVTGGRLQIGFSGTGSNSIHHGEYEISQDAKVSIEGVQTFNTGASTTGTGTFIFGRDGTEANSSTQLTALFTDAVTFDSKVEIKASNLAHPVSGFSTSIHGTAPASGITFNGPLSLISGNIGPIPSVAINGSFDWQAGNFDGAGTTTISEDTVAELTTSGSKIVNAHTLVNDGTMNISTTRLDLRTNATLNNTGTIHFSGHAVPAMATNLQGQQNTLNNSGLFRKSGAGTITNIGPDFFHNTGTVQVDSGTLDLNNTGMHEAADFGIASGGVLRLSWSHEVDADTTFTGEGELQVAGNTAFNGTTIGVPTRLESGIMSGSGVAFDQDVIWTGGSMSGNATTTLSPGRTLHFTGAGSKFLSSSRTLLNQGAMTMDAALGLAGGSRLENEGQFTVNGAVSFGNAAGTIVNLSTGIFIKNGEEGQTTSMAGIPFENSGVVEARGGTLSFDSTYTQTAGSLVLKGGRISKPGSAMAINGGKLEGSGTVTGAVAVNGGTVDPGTVDPELGAIPGVLVTSSLSLTGSSSTLAFDVLGAEPGEVPAPGVDHDQLQVTGTLTLGGNLSITFPDDIIPVLLDEPFQFVLATANSITGSFANAPSGAVATTLDGRYSFRVHYGVGSEFPANQIVIKEISELIPPVLALPGDIGPVEAERLLTDVAFAVSANDNIDGAVTAIASLTPGGAGISSPHAFPIGTTTVHVQATDSRGNTATGSFDVTVQDTTPPELTVPSSATKFTTDINGTMVDFVTSATDLPDAAAPVIVAEPASGSNFPLGTTVVTVTATDHVGLETVKTFPVIVTGQPDIGVQFTGGQEIPNANGKIVFDPTPVLTPAAPKSITIRNDGAAGLTLGTLTFSGDADFSSSQLIGTPILAPGESIALDIGFTPAEQGIRSATLHLASNDPDEATFNIQVSGTGISPPEATTRAATAITYHGATLNGEVNPNAAATTVTFEYGTTPAYGQTIAASPASPLSGEAPIPVSASLAGLLLPETTYHFRVKAVNANGTSFGEDMTFTTNAASPGSLDTSFAASVNGLIHTMAVQPDGKIVIGGEFTSVGGVSRNRIARLNSDGSLDISFEPGTGIPSGRVLALAVHKDGRILLGGQFTMVNGVTKKNLVRLNPNGSIDDLWITQVDSFIGSASVNSILIDEPDRIHVGGMFTTVSRPGIASDSSSPRYVTLDLTGRVVVQSSSLFFNPFQPAEEILGMGLEADRSLVVTGQVGAGSNIARVPLSGPLAYPWQAAGARQVAIQPDGKLVILQRGTSADSLSRAQATGSVDIGYNPTLPFARFSSLTLQADSKLLVTANGGSGSTSAVTRLLPADGSVDSGFTSVPLSPFTEVTSVAQQADGRILIAGSFTTVDGVSRQRIARLLNEPASDSLTVTLPDRIEWLRGSSAPETHNVFFEHSLDGGVNWQVLGQGSRISGAWQYTGTLPPGGTIRASARTTGGRLSSSSGLVQSVAAYNSPTISDIANQATDEDIPLGPIAFTISDPDLPASELTLSAASSNPALVPAANIVFGGSDGNRTVTITSLPDLSGITTITLTVSNGTLSAFTSFVVTVNAVNDAPTITQIADQTIQQDEAVGPIQFTINDVDDNPMSLIVTATSDNPGLVSQTGILIEEFLSEVSPFKTITVTPEPGQSGTALITVTVSDGATSTDMSFLLAVNPNRKISIALTEGAGIENGETLDLGSVDIGANAETGFTISNLGTLLDLNLTGSPRVGITGHTTDFTITPEPEPSATIAPGGSTTFTVRFAPTAVGLRSAQLLIESNDSNEGTYIINLTGTGISPGPLVPPAFASPPVIIPATVTQGAGLSATVAGAPGSVVTLEASGDLGLTIPWQVIGQITLDESGQGAFDAATHRDNRSQGPPAAKGWFFRLRQD